MNNLLNFCVFL